MSSGLGWRVLGSLPAALALAVAAPAGAQCDRLPRCELVWADEFDGSLVDESKWEFMTGTGTAYGLPAGWGNNELQYYQAENAAVSGGYLTITARRESVGGRNYTSARLRSRERGDWTYGRMEMRARMPVGQGLWPAFWMLPTDTSLYGTWAASGEIDILEYLGSEPERAFGTLHYGAPWPNNTYSGNDYFLPAGGFHEDFHVFAIEWERGVIRWYVDDVHYATQSRWFSTAAPYPAPFDVDFHLLLNLAVGGNLPGPPNDSTSFPQELVVDYVRVYQSKPLPASQSAATTRTYDKPVRARKLSASVSLPFENQARKRDRADNPRQVSCQVVSRGAKRVLRPRGDVTLVLEGSRREVLWSGEVVTAELDDRGEATFDRATLAERLAEAEAAGADPERLRLTLSGAGPGKVARLDLDCWQDPGAE